MKYRSFIMPVILVILATLAVFVMTSCGKSSDNWDKHVRVAFFPNITHAQALTGMDNGQFQKVMGDTAQIDWKMFNAGPAEIEAVFAGEIDIGYIGPGPALNAFVKSRGDVKIIAGVCDGGAILVSRKDLKLKDIKELDGKRIAVPQYGNTQDLCLRDILVKAGLKPKAKGGTVDIRQVENPDVKTLMDKGELDAALVPEPWGSILVNDIQANVVLEYDKIMGTGRYPTAVMIVRKAFLEQHPDVVERFVQAHLEVTDAINKDPEAAQKSMNNSLNKLLKKPLDEKILKTAMSRMTITCDPEKSAVRELSALSVAAGFYQTSPDVDQVIDLSVINKVLTNAKREPIKP